MQCNVPGAAIGIVQDGAIIYEQEFGVRNLGKQEKVTPQTLFMIVLRQKHLLRL